MTKSYEKMTKAELVSAIKFLKLENTVNAKDPDAPTNAEYVTALNAFKATQDPEGIEEQEEKEKPKDTKKAPKRSVEELRDIQVADLSRSINVIVTDHETGTTVDEDEDRRVVEIRWGNPMIGMTTTGIKLDGKPQYVSIGALKALKRKKLAGAQKDANGTETVNMDRKRFSVAEVAGWTEDEFAAHKEAQKLKRI